MREHPLHLPDGSTLGEALRANPTTASVPSLALTSWATTPELDRARQDFAAEVLILPLPPFQMVARVEEMLGVAA